MFHVKHSPPTSSRAFSGTSPRPVPILEQAGRPGLLRARKPMLGPLQSFRMLGVPRGTFALAASYQAALIALLAPPCSANRRVQALGAEQNLSPPKLDEPCSPSPALPRSAFHEYIRAGRELITICGRPASPPFRCDPDASGELTSGLRPTYPRSLCPTATPTQPAALAVRAGHDVSSRVDDGSKAVAAAERPTWNR